MNHFFLDTNIFVYSLDSSAPEKQHIAKELIKDGIKTGKGCISYQVVQEMFNVATKKFSQPLKHDDLLEYTRSILVPMWKVHSSVDLFESSLEVKNRWNLSVYDSLILAAAIESRCLVLYSEDFSNGQEFTLLGNRRITIKNPFL